MDKLVDQWRGVLRELDPEAAMAVAREGGRLLGAFEYAERVVVASLEQIGLEWEAGDVSLAEVYLAGKVSGQAIDDLVPQSSEGAVLAVCVLDDYHTLGKSLVLASLRTAQIAADDLGVVDIATAVRLVEERNYRLLFVSTLMLRSALAVEALIEQLAIKGLKTRVVVGGAPFRMDPALASRVGAHAMGVSASEAVKLARSILSEEQP